MSELVTITNVSRRAAIRRIAAAFAAAGAAAVIEPADAQHVHAEAAKMKGALGGYKRQLLTEHEWATVSRLAELIVPADATSPSAVEAGAPEFIDLLCSQSGKLANIYHGGISWLDAKMRQRHDKTFIDAAETAQKKPLDELAAEAEADEERERAGREPGPYARFRDYRADGDSELSAGAQFFDWVRKMTVDAYYTSPAGVKDLGYLGNGAYSEYTVPQEAIDYAMKRSPLATDD